MSSGFSLLTLLIGAGVLTLVLGVVIVLVVVSRRGRE